MRRFTLNKGENLYKSLWSKYQTNCYTFSDHWGSYPTCLLTVHFKLSTKANMSAPRRMLKWIKDEIMCLVSIFRNMGGSTCALMVKRFSLRHWLASKDTFQCRHHIASLVVPIRVVNLNWNPRQTKNRMMMMNFVVKVDSFL